MEILNGKYLMLNEGKCEIRVNRCVFHLESACEQLWKRVNGEKVNGARLTASRAMVNGQKFAGKRVVEIVNA